MKHISHFDANNIHAYARSKFFLTLEFKWLHHKSFNSNKYGSNSLDGCVLAVDLEYPKELCELQNDYPLAPEKEKLKKENLSNYQLKIANFYNTHIGNVKKLAPIFLIKKGMCFIMKTYEFV